MTGPRAGPGEQEGGRYVATEGRAHRRQSAQTAGLRRLAEGCGRRPRARPRARPGMGKERFPPKSGSRVTDHEGVTGSPAAARFRFARPHGAAGRLASSLRAEERRPAFCRVDAADMRTRAASSVACGRGRHGAPRGRHLARARAYTQSLTGTGPRPFIYVLSASASSPRRRR